MTCRGKGHILDMEVPMQIAFSKEQVKEKKNPNTEV